MRAYRDKKGRATNKSLGMVGVFDSKIKSELTVNLTQGESRWLRDEMEQAAALCVAESREVLAKLASRVDQTEDSLLKDEKVYRALRVLAEL